MTTTPRSAAEIEEFLDLARERYQVGLDADQIDRTEAEADNVFANASDTDKKQWDQIPLKSRRDNHRPILQWNRIPTYVQQVVNDGRQNKPAIKISQADGGQKETAEFFQSRIRQIEYDSDADIAYDTARDQQVTSGRGFIRIYTEDIPGTFNQRLCIDPIENQFSVVFDPSAKKYDRSDAEWCFVVSRISKDKHERDYGKESIVSRIDWNSSDNPAADWIGCGERGDMVQIAEYWCKQFRKRTMYLLPNNIPIWADEIEEDMVPFLVKGGDGKPLSREDQDATIYRYIINGAEILEEGEWIGSTIPIVPFWGRQAVVGGIRRSFSLIRMAKDPQRLVNLYVSNIAEQIAMMPKAPYEAPVGSIADNHIPDWRDAGMTAKAVLFYQQWTEDGRELARPSRVVNEPPIQALSIGLNQAIDAIKAAMGIYDASLGARSNETSGVAIERRKNSAEIVNFHFTDNESRSRKRIGEILIELIPKLDKPGSKVPIRAEDGKTELVPIGEPYQHPKTGEEITHNLDQGQYGVTVSTGPSFNSSRKEENERLTEWVKAYPALLEVVGDQIMRTSDYPGAQDIADRMENWIKARNPGVIRDVKDQKPLPPEVIQKFQQLQQELQVTQAFAASLHQKIETEQPKLDNAKEIERMKLDFEREKLQVTSATQLNIAEIKAGLEADIETLRGELARIDQERGIQAQQQAQETEHQHQAEMADKQQAGALEAQQQAAELAPAGGTK